MPHTIGFNLSRITTEQFAIIEDNYAGKGPVEMTTNLNFGLDKSKKAVGVFSQFTFQEKKKQFIVLEVACHFVIEEKSWKLFYNKGKDKFIMPKDFITHLSVITVGAARGVLHAKTENHVLNKFVIPPINITELVKQDVSL